VSNTHFDPLVHVAQDDHPDQVGQARAEAGRAIRDIGHALVGHDVPIGEPLTCRTRLARRDGRKLHMTGELTVTATGQVLARSSATFIAIDPSHFNPEAGSGTGTAPSQV